MRISFLVCIVLLSFWWALGTWASDFHSPRTAALGGSSHAGPLLNDAIYLNPSFTSFLPTYAFSFNYLWFRGGETFPDGSSFFHGKNLNASIQDGRSELFQAGVGFTQTEDARYLHIGASKAVIKQLGFGLGGKFIFPADSTHQLIRDAMFSVTGVASNWMQIVGVVDNLFETPEGKARGLYREFVLGTKFNIQGIVLVYFDPHYVPSLSSGAYGHESGLEFPIMRDFFLRFGAFRNAMVPFENQRGSGYASGFGWLAPRMSFDFAISRVLDPLAATAYSIGMTMYF